MKFGKIALLNLTIIGAFQSYFVFANDIENNVLTDDNESGIAPRNVRFNKFAVLDTSFEGLPLVPGSYPISENPDVAQFLKEGTNCISVVDDKNDHEVIYNVSELIDIVGGEPTHPSRDRNSGYWDMLLRVIKMRKIGQNKPDKKASNKLRNEMQLPRRWSNYSVYQVGEAVHDEYPGLHQSEFIGDLATGHYGPIEYDYDIIPQRSMSQFLRGIVMLSDINTWTAGVVGPHNFGAKWYGGRARPEEIAWLIKTDQITFAPRAVKRELQKINFDSANAFTQYPEGSPRHPSWPAMHSAASNISFWLQVVMNLTPEQLCEAQKVDFAVSFARTVAGVHFEDDNIAGLNMGQEVVARAIPDYFEAKYGSNKANVRQKVNEKRFLWEHYNKLAECDSSDD